MLHLTSVVDIRDNLRQCCATQLNKRLFDVKGATMLDAASEENLLSWIKEIAVKGVHKEVHRTQFVHCKQKQGECLNSYHGRLRAEASLCDFRVSAPTTCDNNGCTCVNHGIKVSYQDDMVATQLVAGLYNADHQSKVLSESATLTTLDAKLKRLQVLEKSDTSLSSLSNTEAFSNYTAGGDNERNTGDHRRQKNSQRKQKWEKADKESTPAGEKCADCGKKHSQCGNCKGFHKCTTRCNHCKKMGHIKNCCRKFLQL